jgi:hypothetical protein
LVALRLVASLYLFYGDRVRGATWINLFGEFNCKHTNHKAMEEANPRRRRASKRPALRIISITS